MSEKPKKRLVSKKDFARESAVLIGKATARVFLGAVCLVMVPVLFILLTVMAFILLHAPWYAVIPLFTPVIIALIYFLWTGLYLLNTASDGERVEVITEQNAHRLPPAESLVRASDLPPSHQQTELLRAAPQGSETPPEELLRATTKQQGD